MPDSCRNITAHEPAYDLHVLRPKSSTTCIVSAAWDEGTKSYDQYRRMLPYSRRMDFIIANFGPLLLQQGFDVLKDELGICTILQMQEAGQSTAYRAALAFALSQGYERIIMIDSNGKDGVEAIPAFESALMSGAALVQGCRFATGGEHQNTPLLRLLAIRVVAAGILWLGCGYWYRDQTNGFKGFSRAFLQDPRVAPFRDDFRGHNLQIYLNYRAAKLGYQIAEIPTRRNYPESGPIPTKIGTMSQWLKIFWEYLKVSAGAYNPERCS
jgi:dolichol-phosphate mannosyltransferase